MNPVHFSSASEDWATPQDFFDALDAEFKFRVDLCASPANAKCRAYFTKEANALDHDWVEETDHLPPDCAAWMNPPYGRGIGEWVAKAARTGARGRTVVALLPARTDTRWWHTHIWDATKHAPRPGVEVRLIPGRLKFGGSKNSAPFPSAVVVFHGQIPDSQENA